MASITSLSERFSVADVVEGLAQDLKALRAGAITLEQGRVRAELARQFISGIRLYVQAGKFMEREAVAVKTIGEGTAGERGT